MEWLEIAVGFYSDNGLSFQLFVYLIRISIHIDVCTVNAPLISKFRKRTKLTEALYIAIIFLIYLLLIFKNSFFFQFL